MKLKELCKEIIKIENSPLGDLCEYMLDDYKFPWDKSIGEMWSYLEWQRIEHGDHLDEPIKELKRIYYGKPRKWKLICGVCHY